MNERLLTGLLGLTVAFVSACGDDEDNPNPITPEVTASNQQLADADMVRVTRVDAERAGFIAIYLDDAGSRGTYLGSAPVNRGRTDDVDVTLSTEVPENTRLRATLHVDVGTRGEFEFPTDPSLDPPATPLAEAAFDVVIEVDDALLQASDQSPSELSVLEIDRVDTATAGFIRIVQSVNGAAAGPSVGVAAVPAGRHLELPVSLERDAVDGETLIAFLHEDSNGNGELDWTGAAESEDPPILGNDGEPLEASITVSSTIAPGEIVLANDQVATSSTTDLEIVSIVSDDAGFVAVYELDGQAELVLPARAHAPVATGLTALVELPTAVGSSTTALSLEIVLHRDSDQDGVFEYDGGAIDPPATLPGGDRVSARIDVVRAQQ